MQSIDPIYSPFPTHIVKKDTSLILNMLHCSPVSLITSKYKGRTNIMPVSQYTVVSTDPPYIGIAIERSRFSLDIIKASEEFAINIPTLSLLHYVEYLGRYTGEQMDKIDFLQIETFTPVSITAPLLHKCCAWIELEVHDIHTIGNHELVIGYPKMLFADPASFSDGWLTSTINKRPLIYIDTNRYSVLGKEFLAKTPQGGDNHLKKMHEITLEHMQEIKEDENKLQEKMHEISKEISNDVIADMAAAIINDEIITNN
ncbi:MAG: NADH-FMN oxidoreductase RutF, flavin reductase (DIM6/NTAB) family [Chloroflexi bacterium]|jgi:flavin reductase (DIM6/NTAB) family NADH-FMN oxidoreductase RutF|nr:MAG: NADH-FMN oxidoreductase RutF, flavin reductase (DIM6/NTAB) family [Chloroflexota bacterium]|tara:strand:- start:114 stop:887 length:774 start_codon:yes stop_codon:yes gene_type:complete